MKTNLLYTGLILLAGVANVMADDDDLADQATVGIDDVATYAEVDWTAQTKNGTTSGGTYYGFSFTLSASNPRMTVTSDPLGGSRTAVQELTSISVQWKSGAYYTANLCLAITDSDGTVLGMTTQGAFPATSGGWARFDFGNLQLIDGLTYRAYFVSPNTSIVGQTVSTQNLQGKLLTAVEVGADVGTSTDLRLIKNTGVLDYEAAKWAPSVIIMTSNIPEPATATLSLLALAGLCARRRRK